MKLHVMYVYHIFFIIAIESIPSDTDRYLSGTSSQSIMREECDTVITLAYHPEVLLAAKSVHLNFLKLVCQLKQELKAHNLEAFITVCKKLTVSASDLNAIPLIPSEYLEYLDDAGIEEIFSRLSFLWTWNDHSILRALLEACNCQDGIKMLDEFESQVDTNQPMELLPIPPPLMKMAPSLSSLYTLLSIRGEEDLVTSLQHINDVARVMTKMCEILPHGLQLLAARVTPLMLYWVIPKSIVPLISEGVNKHLVFFKEKRFLEISIYPNTILFATDILGHGSFALLSPQLQVSLFVVYYSYKNEVTWLCVCSP